jgi:polysaccharide biosynthesis protein PslG
MRPWRYRGANPNGWWCASPNCYGARDGVDFARRELSLARDLGVRLVRLEIPWPLIEFQPGRYAWSRSDALFSLARRRRIELLPVLVYTPSWARADPADPPTAGAFGRFAGAFAKRYARQLRSYELWNEPDLRRYWSGTQEAFVRLVLRPGAAAIRRSDRGARIVVGPSRADGWLAQLYEVGGREWFDVVAFHDYSDDVATIAAGATALRRVLDAHGDNSKQLWLGEFGVQDPRLDDERHVELLTGVLARPGPIRVAAWYSLRDDHVLACCPPRVILSESYGLVTDRYERKQSFTTLQRLLRR